MSNAVVWQELRERPLRVESWLKLARGYARDGLPWHLAYVQTQVQRMPLASAEESAWREELAGLRCAPSAHWQTSELLSRPGEPGVDVAKVCDELREHLATQPDDWLSLLYLARCLDLRKAGPDGVALFEEQQQAAVRRALDSEVVPGETGHLLAMWRLRAGDVAGALAALQAVLNHAPQRHGSWLLQAEAMMLAGMVREGQQAFERAGRSRNPRFLELLADRLLAFSFPREALTVCKAVVDIEPHNTAARGLWEQIQRTLLQERPPHPTLQ